MTTDLIKERRRRIRLVKKWLKPLPRRSNIHRYPVLKWFGNSAKKRTYLWSFRSREMIPAIFLGLIVALMPLVGIQMLVVTLLALFVVRANLPVLVGLQWVSNPLTMGPIYYADYQIGIVALELFGIDLDIDTTLRDFDWSEFQWKEIWGLIDTFPPMMLGGLIIGSFAGLVGVALYKILALRAQARYPSSKYVESNNGEDKE